MDKSREQVARDIIMKETGCDRHTASVALLRVRDTLKGGNQVGRNSKATDN